ncbi:MAG TPA: choline kinase family protein [Afifellaceae bacterium]|nr:choline kinase family protein [Afifellaceae bacterium]
MENDATEQARAALKFVPAFAGLDPNRVEIERLGGLTNLVFRVSYAGDNWCLRLPGAGTEEYIDRAVEAVAAREAARAGVSPPLIFSDPESGIMVTRFVEGAETMTGDLFRSRPCAPARAGEAFRKLHSSDAKFDFVFELFSMVDGYLGILAGKTIDLPDGYHDVLKEAESVRRALQAAPAEITACHCDPLAENFLDTGERMWIVDWEYSGMNDPMWDLGDLSVEAGFDDAQDEEMIRAYFGDEPRPGERGRIVIYKAMCDLLWTLWGLIQHANGNPAEDFWAYSTGRFARCKTLMATPEFNRHVAAVAAG